MMLLVCFDLPRYSSEERRQAAKFQKRLVSLGFSMKQFSLYERPIRQSSSIKKIINIISRELPDTGAITMYTLPNEIHNKQITILGEKVKEIKRKPSLRVF
ncbi:CRISPR-associated endonuclease Cas2 [Staphylococcus simulans]